MVSLLLCTSAAAQHAPLVINNETVGEPGMRQVGALILPNGQPPFPAVVVLHGCNGVSPNTRTWARRLASWGYAALILDSFTSRNINNVCGHGLDLSGRERGKDALAAAAYLRTRADIDPNHIGLLGYSHGGWSALAAARDRLVAESGTKPFAAIVAYYPSCPPGAPKLASDVQILAGDADDWAPVKRCTDLLARYPEGAPHRPRLKIYPGALHSFDADRPERLYFGHKLGYDAKAAADSFDVTKKFLDSHLR
jgi:dienelactone hydrolase